VGYGAADGDCHCSGCVWRNDHRVWRADYHEEEDANRAEEGERREAEGGSREESCEEGDYRGEYVQYEGGYGHGEARVNGSFRRDSATGKQHVRLACDSAPGKHGRYRQGH
jgi:hypothetical protein